MQKIIEKKNIPEGWSVCSLGDIASVTNGSTNTQDAVIGGEYPLFDRSVEIKRSDKFLFDAAVIVLPGEGADFVPRYYQGKFDLHQRAYAIFPLEDVDVRFLYQYLYANKKEFLKKSVGSTVRSLRLPIIQSVRVNVPPLNEQQKIAEILGAVDEDIAKTKEVIKTTEKLKRGLMQQLFTRGIGHTKFKHTEIGEVPEEWEVALLDDVANRGSGHTPNKKVPGYYDGGIKWISLADSNRLERGLISQTKIEISEEGIKHSSAVVHPKGTVLMSRDAGIGRSAVMGEDMAVSQHFMTWECGERLYNWYLYYYLQSYKKEFERIAIGSTIKTIGLPYFKKFQIPLPPIAEQQKIADTFASIDAKITVNKKLLAKLTELKKGLMQDLLSGKVRVQI